jgi:DNA repair protein RadD
MLELREYQKEALRQVYGDLNHDDNPVLLQAIMGAGKSIMACKLVERFYNTTNRTFLILSHKREITDQFYKTFLNATNIPKNDVGICCSGLGKKEVGKRVTVGTIQTYFNIKFPAPISLLILDECHKVSVGTESQYDTIINRLNALSPTMRILGLTATPSRLGHGYIYGKKHRPGRINLFSKVNHKIEYETLKTQGHLVELRGKVATHKSLQHDLDGVQVSGDYTLQELGDVMSQQRHIETAVDAIKQYCQLYNKICVFCCTISHAETLNKLLGDESTIIHSQLTPLERFSNMEDWKSGRKRIITSIMILSEGFDLPSLDCLVMVRPTLSSVLFMQSVGRVLRTHHTKDHGFLLDLTPNTEYFGTNLDNIKVSVPKGVQKLIDQKQELIKLCPQCEKEVHVALRRCDCGYQWPEAEFEVAYSIPDMKNVKFEKEPPKWVEVETQLKTEHTARKSGKRLGRVIFTAGENIYKPDEYSMWFCLADEYDGFAVQKAQINWGKISQDPFPQSVDEFLTADIEQISKILIDDNGDYPEIKDIEIVPF